MRRALLVLAVLLTSLLVGWVLLAAVLLHSGPTGAQPVILILAVLLAVTGGLKGGQLKQASLDEFLKSTQTSSFIVIKDDAILYEGYTRTTSFPNLRSQALSVKPDGETPGAAFNYNKYYPQLLGMILERTTRRPVSEYLQEKIWKPLGMEYPVSWSLDSEEHGFERMEGDLYGRAIDFAKFGALFLNNGNWNGRQIIPEKWVIESTSPDPDDNRHWRVATDWKAANGYYKYMWWGLRRPDGSYIYMARGGLQQLWVYVSPKDRVVIARFGLIEGGTDWWPDVFERLIAKLNTHPTFNATRAVTINAWPEAIWP